MRLIGLKKYKDLGSDNEFIWILVNLIFSFRCALCDQILLLSIRPIVLIQFLWKLTTSNNIKCDCKMQSKDELEYFTNN